MEQIDFFKKLRDISNEIVEAYESEESEKLETAIGKFTFLMIQMDCLK